MASNKTENIYLNRPTAREHNIEYIPQPPPSNPVIRGLPLYYLAQLVASFSFIQRLLWANAGFGKLRDRSELEDVDPRYEPCVSKSAGRKAKDDSPDISRLTGEEWTSKKPQDGVFYSALDYHEAYTSGRTTPLAVAEALLPLIRRDVKNATKHSTAFLASRSDLVRKAAEESTQRYRAGQPLSPLDGVPTAVKDEEDIAGYAKCLGSKLDFTNKDDVTSYCVQQWLDAGAICIGKTTMHELGCDTTNCNPIYGTPLNPNNPHYYCGGSSGGSAYAIAAGLVPFAMGNDGGGSIRIPAAYCGLFGLKTSHGRVSIWPSSNLARSTGVPGPLAATMIDLELSYRVMATPDALNNDSAMFEAPNSVFRMKANRKKILGIYRTWFDRADEAVQKVCWKGLDYLTTQLGYEIVDISIPLIHEGQLAHAMTILAELASGIPSVKELTGPTKVLVCTGKQTPAVDFLQAQKLRTLLMEHLAHLYDKYPGMIIVTPTTPNAGWHIHQSDLNYGCSDANTSIRNMEYVWLANFSGCPAISVPVGYVDPVEGTGLVPVGLMGMGEWCSEDDLLAFGYDAEQWLHEGLEGGRPKPENWIDVIELAQRANAK